MVSLERLSVFWGDKGDPLDTEFPEDKGESNGESKEIGYGSGGPDSGETQETR
jgi:hypothetical protein